MSRLFRVLLAITTLGTACAAGRGRIRPRVDKEAMREAEAADAPEHYASPKAFEHYLRARLAEGEGDFRTAAEELKLAIVFDDESATLRSALAEVLARLGLLDRAEQECKDAIRSQPKSEGAADAHLLLGKIYSAQRKRDPAVAELKAAIQGELRAEAEAARTGDPRPPQGEAWRVLGSIYLDAGDEAAAAKTFDDLAAHVPGDGSGFRDMGRLYLERRDWARAEKYLKKALEKDPSDEEAWRKLAQLYEGRRRFDEARSAWENVVRVDSDDQDAPLALGKLALRKGDAAGARAYFQQLLGATSDDAGARVNVAFAWLDAHDDGEALKAIEGAADASDARLVFVRGLVLQDLKRWDEAAAAFAGIPADDSELYASARMNLGYCLSQANRHAEAAAALAEALLVRPREIRLITMLAFVKERAGKVDEAIDLLQKAVAEREKEAGGPREDFADLYDALASSLEKANRTQEAIAVLQKALGTRPRDESLLYALGTAYEKVGDGDAALEKMRAVLAVDPEHADAMNFIGYTLADRGVRLEEAQKLIERALELKPDNGYFLDSLGWVYFKKGDYRRAVEVLEKADKLSGPEATILEHLGDAYRLASRPRDAADAYRRALKTFDVGAPSDPVQRASLERKLRELPDSPSRQSRVEEPAAHH